MKETRREFVKMVGGAVAAATVLLMGGSRSAHAQQKPQAKKNNRDFRAGEKVPTSGVYDVIHDKIDGQVHAIDHQLTLVAGNVFPNCKACQGWVRFRIYYPVDHVGTNPNFGV
jgi:hypothetical protein